MIPKHLPRKLRFQYRVCSVPPVACQTNDFLLSESQFPHLHNEEVKISRITSVSQPRLAKETISSLKPGKISLPYSKSPWYIGEISMSPL